MKNKYYFQMKCFVKSLIKSLLSAIKSFSLVFKIKQFIFLCLWLAEIQV